MTNIRGRTHLIKVIFLPTGKRGFSPIRFGLHIVATTHQGA